VINSALTRQRRLKLTPLIVPCRYMFLFLCRFKFFEGFGADAVLSILLRGNSFSSAIPRPHTVIAAKPSLV